MVARPPSGRQLRGQGSRRPAARLSRRGVWPTERQVLLLRAALLRDERALAAWDAVRSGLDVATLDGTSLAILPALRANLEALGVRDELMGIFKGVHRFTWAKNQVLFNRTLPAIAELETASIPTLLLKGAALVAGSPLDAGMRAMNDIDVLVPTARAGEAIGVLLACGFVPLEGAPAWYVAEYGPRFTPSFGFEAGDDRQLDLHWHVLHASCQPDADDEFWAAAVEAEIRGVATRVLCATDELALAVLHGLRWDADQAFRWILDATLLLSGARGPIDHDRLVAQARRRNVTFALWAGLSYLHDVIGSPVPADVLRTLRSTHPSRLERAELRAQMTVPRQRTPRDRAVLAQWQYVRRELPLGVRATGLRHLSLARRRLGIGALSDLRRALPDGVPGPGRPLTPGAAAVGRGEVDRSAAPVEPGAPVELGVSGAGRSYVRYGTWRPEERGSWIAGREAALTLPLAGPANKRLALSVWAEALLARRSTRQCLDVMLGGQRLARWSMDSVHTTLESETVLLPRSISGRQLIDLEFAAPNSLIPASVGLSDEERSLGVFLRRLVVREPRRVALEEEIRFGGDGTDETVLAGGWWAAELDGRWTRDRAAAIWMSIADPAAAVAVELDADPFLGDPRRRLDVGLFANGRRVASASYSGPGRQPRPLRAPLPPGTVEDDGELVLTLRISRPVSPLELGVLADPRPLGLFVRSVVVHGAAAEAPLAAIANARAAE